LEDETPPYWFVISVLFSTQPLTPALARTLYERAFEMHRRDESHATLDGDMLQGSLAVLEKNALLGAISGPSYEAQIETERGAGVVRFLLTWRGIEWLSSHTPSTEMN
jgi:hypothetical protein